MSCLAVLVLSLLTAYVTPAFLIRYSYRVQSALVYMHVVRIPYSGNLSEPEQFGLNATRHFDLLQYDGCPVGVWHTLPSTYHHHHIHNHHHQHPHRQQQLQREGGVSRAEDYEAALSDGAPIVLYLHGNTGSRATPHRVQVYHFLASRGYHVVSFDYRGFGDSTCSPSERGVMEDALLVWNWIDRVAKQGRPVYIWGHSLGSAVATHLSLELWNRGAHPKGVILDAPFTSMVEAVVSHIFGLPYWPLMPLFRYFVAESFQERFESESRLKLIPYPILILHGHNDIIIPYYQGQQMYETAVDSRRKNPLLREVRFVDCGESQHKTNHFTREVSLALDYFIGK